jgi:hypothetical protein
MKAENVSTMSGKRGVKKHKLGFEPLTSNPPLTVRIVIF